MKANSERVPNKNFKSIAGKPLFNWMLSTLCSLDVVDRVIINTDANDDLFSSYLENNKIILRKRSPNLCGDLVSMNKIIEDDILNDENNIFLMTHTRISGEEFIRLSLKLSLDLFEKIPS